LKLTLVDKTALLQLAVTTSLVETRTKPCDEIFVHKLENGSQIDHSCHSIAQITKQTDILIMPAKDIAHDAVKQALEKDNWTITHDPFYVQLEDIDL
jgi:hypothetical protein